MSADNLVWDVPQTLALRELVRLERFQFLLIFGPCIILGFVEALHTKNVLIAARTRRFPSLLQTPNHPCDS